MGEPYRRYRVVDFPEAGGKMFHDEGTRGVHYLSLPLYPGDLPLGAEVIVTLPGDPDRLPPPEDPLTSPGREGGE